MVQILCGNPTAYSLERCDILLRRNKMGRPINKKFFGNAASPYDNQQTGGTSGVGGEGVASVTFSNSGTLYSQGTTVSFAAPNIKGGVRALGTPVIDAAGLLRDVTITVRGTGYTSAPALTVTTASSVVKASTGTIAQTVVYPETTTGIYVGMKAIGTGISASATYVVSVVGAAVNLTWPNAGAVTTASSISFVDTGASFASSIALTAATYENAIAFTSFLLAKDGGANAVTGGDIHKQESSRRYLVENSEGIGQVKLVATDALTAGTMNIIATDGAGSTYFVRKLTAKKAYLVNRTSTSTAVVSGLVAQWTVTGSTGNTLITAATGTTQVSIANN
jgi:hypothetical protein